MKYYIADTHFNHPNIIKQCQRPFKTLEEMNEILISNWNDIVKSTDEVYIVGDFAYKGLVNLEEILKKLNGHKHLIIGNHDEELVKNKGLMKYFQSVTDILEVVDNERLVILCHYPIISWSKKEQGTYHVYGHLHNWVKRERLAVEYLENIKAYNAGVDVNDFKPVTLDQLINNKIIFYQKFNALENSNNEVIL